jgi:hypothetical protein
LQPRDSDRGCQLRAVIVNPFFVAFLISSTSILTVALGVFGAYWTVCAVLAAVNPAKTSKTFSALVPHQSQVGGD